MFECTCRHTCPSNDNTGFYLLQSSAGSLLSNFITSALVEAISSRCSCGFISSFISGEQVFCDRLAPSEFVYRAAISNYSSYSTDQLLDYIEQWVSSGVTLMYEGNQLTFDPKCLLRISSNEDQLCMTTTPGAGLSYAAAIGIALGCVMVGILATIMMTVLLLMIHRVSAEKHGRYN